MVRPIGDWGSVMSGAHLRMRAKASQRRAPRCRCKVRMSGLCKVEMSAFLGAGGRRKKFAGQLGPPGALDSLFFARLIVVECHQSFEVLDANVRFAEDSGCDFYRACRNLRGQFTGAGWRAIQFRCAGRNPKPGMPERG